MHKQHNGLQNDLQFPVYKNMSITAVVFIR